jgi:hypothetical protein
MKHAWYTRQQIPTIASKRNNVQRNILQRNILRHILRVTHINAINIK